MIGSCWKSLGERIPGITNSVWSSHSIHDALRMWVVRAHQRWCWESAGHKPTAMRELSGIFESISMTDLSHWQRTHQNDIRHIFADNPHQSLTPYINPPCTWVWHKTFLFSLNLSFLPPLPFLLFLKQRYACPLLFYAGGVKKSDGWWASSEWQKRTSSICHHMKS